MSKKNIPFSPPDMSEAERKEVAEAFRSGWITTGPKTKEFEHLISMCCQTVKYGADGKPLPTTACLNSATACMELALRVLGIGEGDEVIVPAYTYTATASSVCHVGARPVLIDCAPGSFEIDYEKFADAITERTKAVMPVDLGGVVADYDKVFAAVEAKKHLFRPANDIQRAYGRCIVIADAAHAFGDMSLVGPRPEVRKYVDMYTPEQMRVLDVRPGITSLASIRYRNENDILAAAKDPDRAYVEQVMPDKLAIDLEYVTEANLWTDIKLIFSTFKEIITR